MLKTLEEKLNELSPERRKKVEARAAELISREMTLHDSRLSTGMTKQEMIDWLEKEKAETLLECRRERFQEAIDKPKNEIDPIDEVT